MNTNQNYINSYVGEHFYHVSVELESVGPNPLSDDVDAGGGHLLTLVECRRFRRR